MRGGIFMPSIARALPTLMLAIFAVSLTAGAGWAATPQQLLDGCAAQANAASAAQLQTVYNAPNENFHDITKDAYAATVTKQMQETAKIEAGIISELSPEAALQKAKGYDSIDNATSDTVTRLWSHTWACMGRLQAAGAGQAPSARAAATLEADLIAACSREVATERASMPSRTDAEFANLRDTNARVLASDTNINDWMPGRIASDTAFLAAHPDPVGSANVCMIRRRLEQIRLGMQQPQQAQQAQQNQQRPLQQRQAMAAAPKPQNNSGAGQAGQPNPHQLFQGKPAVAQEASHCLSLVKDPQLYGGFTNSCDFPVYVAFCAYHPKKGAWSEAFDCDHDAPGIGRGGLAHVNANATEGTHTHNAERIFWFACRQPSFPKVKYSSGSGFFGHCQ